MAGSHLSKDFFDLIKAIGEAKSKQEEDRIVVIEVADAKKRLADRTLTGKRLKEYLLRLVYVEMLGHDASFGYMKSVELSASANLLEKRVAYLCAGLCFAPEHEFRMMLVNRLQRDLQSANVLEVSIALSASAKILTTDMIPAVLPIVANLLKHDQEIVRKKTVMLLHRFLQLSPESVSHMADKFRRALCDKDPSVMGASLHLFTEMIKVDPAPYKDLVPSFVSILKQVVEHRLPRDFDYHRVPAPWLQMKMLRILAAQGRADQASSEQMYEVLLDVIRRGDTGTNVGYAILYECVKTVTTIYPNAALLDAAAASIARFITSESHNLKYLGVTGLAAIVKDHPKYAAEHQLAVIDCLEDPDDTLKRKTLDLLYRMINPVNVEVIVAKLLDHLASATDSFLRSDLVTRITAAAERFAPSNVWYVSTIAAAFELGGELVRPEVASNLIRLIAEGSGESPAADAELRRAAVVTLLALANKPQLPNVLLQTLFWVVGEYGALAAAPPEVTLATMCQQMVELAGRSGLDVPTRGHALAALCKLTAQLAGAGQPPPASFSELCTKLAASRHADHAQRVAELSALLARPALLRAVMPVDASTEDIEVDLRFCDGFVAEALASGARAYSKPAAVGEGGGGEGEGGGGGGAGLRFDAYETQQGNFNLPAEAEAGGGGGGGGGAGGAGASGTQLALPAGGLSTLKSAGMWGKEGYKTNAGGVLAEGKVEAGKASVAGPWGAGGAGGGSGSGSVGSSGSGSGGGSGGGGAGGAGAGAGAGAGVATGSLSAFSAGAAPAPAAPRELTEREKMAAAMFGGVAASGAGSAAPKLGAGGAGSALGGAAKFGAGAAPALAAAAAKAPAFGPGSAAAAAPAPAAPAAPAPAASSAAIDLLDIFGSAAPAPAARAPAPSADPFGLAPAAAADPFSAAPRSPFAALPPLPPPALLAALPALACASGERRSPAAGLATIVAGEGGAALGVARVYAPEGLHLLLWVVNTSPTAPLAALGLAVTPPPFLSAALRSGATGAPLALGAPGQPTPLPPLRPGEAAAYALTLTLCAIPSAGQLALALAGSAGGGGAVELGVHEVLRPAPLDTPSFGAIWTQPAMASEAVYVVAGCRFSAPAALLEKVTELHFNPVQAIAATHEAIAAARVMAMPNVYALLHTRASAAGVELRVRTPDKGFTAPVLEALGKLLRGGGGGAQ